MENINTDINEEAGHISTNSELKNRSKKTFKFVKLSNKSKVSSDSYSSDGTVGILLFTLHVALVGCDVNGR